MRTLTSAELDSVYGGLNDGKWYWVDIGHSGQALGVNLPDTLGYRSPNVMLGAWGYQAVASYNVDTGAYNVSINADDGGQTYNFSGGSTGYSGGFTDKFNGNESVGFVVDFSTSGELEMLQFNFTYEFGHEPEDVRGGHGLAPDQPSIA